MLTAIAICVHNFPEGMATFLTTTQDITLGFSVALAIAIHNIPEGIAVALPIYHVTGKKRYAMLYAALSGITEPIGALVGMFIFGLFIPQILVGFLMAAVGGIMTYISFDTLLPLAKRIRKLALINCWYYVRNFIYLAKPNFIRLIKLHLDEIYLRILISESVQHLYI